MCMWQFLGNERAIKYDYFIVGAGFFGSVFAHEAYKRSKSVLTIDRRPYIAGNIYIEEIEGIQVHRYGTRIFHTVTKRSGTTIQ